MSKDQSLVGTLSPLNRNLLRVFIGVVILVSVGQLVHMSVYTISGYTRFYLIVSGLLVVLFIFLYLVDLWRGRSG